MENTARQRIVAGARRRFFAHGFRGVTMDDLAGELAMSKKTLYAHFPSKSALLEAVLLDKFHRIEEDLEQITSRRSSEDPGDFLAVLLQLLACVLRHTEEIQPTFLRDVRRDSPEAFTLVEMRRKDVIQRHFGRLLGQGQRAGVIRQDISVGMILEILLGAVQAIMNPPKMEELGLTPQTGISIILAVILEGVITDRGRAEG